MAVGFSVVVDDDGNSHRWNSAGGQAARARAAQRVQEGCANSATETKIKGLCYATFFACSIFLLVQGSSGCFSDLSASESGCVPSGYKITAVVLEVLSGIGTIIGCCCR